MWARGRHTPQDLSTVDVTTLAAKNGWPGADSISLHEWVKQEMVRMVCETLEVEADDRVQHFVESLPAQLTRHGGLPDIRSAHDQLGATYAFAIYDRGAFNRAVNEQCGLRRVAGSW